MCDHFSIAVDMVADHRFYCICPEERSILCEHVRMRAHERIYVGVPMFTKIKDFQT